MAIDDNIRVVLVNTSHPGNIGAVARAMKNMCLSNLTLVEPKSFPDEEARARASGAEDILQKAVVVDDLASAVSDCQYVVGTTARERSVQWTLFDPRGCGEFAVAQASAGAQVAIVFGRENSGLTNEELDLCTHMIHIPANPNYSSLNIAMAVQVVCYEVMMSMPKEGAELTSVPNEREPASHKHMESFFAHLEQALRDTSFMSEDGAEKLMRRLRRLFHRAEPDADELNILRGILSAFQGRKSMRRD